MTPVDQTKFSENGQRGNCLRACVASIFDIEVDDVVEFEELPKGAWRKGLQEFINDLGCECIQGDSDFIPDDFYIVVGASPTGVRHACVGYGGKVVHDPHPNRLGLSSVEYVIHFSDL